MAGGRESGGAHEHDLLGVPRDGRDGVLDAADEIDAALASGDLVDDGIVKYFVCTLNKVPADG